MASLRSDLRIGDAGSRVFLVLGSAGEYEITKGILFKTVMDREGFWRFYVARIDDKSGSEPWGTAKDVYKTYDEAEDEVIRRWVKWDKERRENPLFGHEVKE